MTVTLKLIHDGTLSSATADDPGSSVTSEGLITAVLDPANPRVARVALTLGPCSPAPILAIERQQGKLALRLDPGQPTQADCPAIGTPFALTLTFPDILGTIDAFAVVDGKEVP